MQVKCDILASSDVSTGGQSYSAVSIVATPHRSMRASNSAVITELILREGRPGKLTDSMSLHSYKTRPDVCRGALPCPPTCARFDGRRGNAVASPWRNPAPRDLTDASPGVQAQHCSVETTAPCRPSTEEQNLSIISHMRCLVSAIGAVGVPLAACGSNSDCNSHVLQLQYSISNGSSAACTVTVSGPTASVVASFAPLANASCADTPSCVSAGSCPCVGCSSVSGPAPLYCERYFVNSVDTVALRFEEPGDAPLSGFTGSSTMLVSVVCGGATIVENNSQTEQCIHGE
jgi:hypothetical protein